MSKVFWQSLQVYSNMGMGFAGYETVVFSSSGAGTVFLRVVMSQEALPEALEL